MLGSLRSGRPFTFGGIRSTGTAAKAVGDRYSLYRLTTRIRAGLREKSRFWSCRGCDLGLDPPVVGGPLGTVGSQFVRLYIDRAHRERAPRGSVFPPPPRYRPPWRA